MKMPGQTARAFTGAGPSATARALILIMLVMQNKLKQFKMSQQKLMYLIVMWKNEN